MREDFCKQPRLGLVLFPIFTQLLFTKANLLAERFFLASFLAFTKLFASLVFRVVGLFSVYKQKSLC